MLPRNNEQQRSKSSRGLAALSIVLGFVMVLQFWPRSTPLHLQEGALLTDTHSFKQAAGLPQVTTRAPYDPALNPLAVPPGKARNLPSIRVEDTLNERTKSTKYGGTYSVFCSVFSFLFLSNLLTKTFIIVWFLGAGDKKHLGGFTVFDVAGVSPSVWKYMVETLGVHSLLDVGCGRGTSTTWFLKHGVDILCAEGSHDAYEKTFLPDPATQMVEHDFSRGPWWPEKTYDAVWAVEFLEHVNVQYHFNYITAFRKCALLFVSSSRWGGWHHVEVHKDEWWIRKYESYGFHYDDTLTQKVRALASAEKKNETAIAPNGKSYNAQHIWLSMKVFVNPAVASMPQHAHLFPEFGCFQNGKGAERLHRECGTGREGLLETPLAKDFYPLKLTAEMDKEWEDLIRSKIAAAEGVVVSGSTEFADAVIQDSPVVQEDPEAATE
jgi:hypothetical protein